MFATRLSAASTYRIPNANTFYGISLAPAAGSTVVVADLLDMGHKPDNNNPATGTFIKATWASAGVYQNLPVPGIYCGQGLSISFTSTTDLTVFHD